MSGMQTDTRVLWERYLSTRSAEHQTALVEGYMPMVQMQTALWVYGLGTKPQGHAGHRAYDGLAEPAAEYLFLPFVPPNIDSSAQVTTIPGQSSY